MNEVAVTATNHVAVDDVSLIFDLPTTDCVSDIEVCNC
jgi:hypothetical protein